MPDPKELAQWDEWEPNFWHFDANGKLMRIPRDVPTQQARDDKGVDLSDIRKWITPKVPKLGELGRAVETAFAPLDILTETTAETGAQIPKLFSRPNQVESPTVFQPGGVQKALGQFRARPLAEQLGLSFLDPGIAVGATKGATAVGRRLLPMVKDRVFRGTKTVEDVVQPGARVLDESVLNRVQLEGNRVPMGDFPVNRVTLERFYQEHPYLTRESSQTLLADMQKVQQTGEPLYKYRTQEILDAIRTSPRAIRWGTVKSPLRTDLTPEMLAATIRGGRGVLEPSMFEPELLPGAGGVPPGGTVSRLQQAPGLTPGLGPNLPAIPIRKAPSMNESIESWINRRLTGSDAPVDLIQQSRDPQKVSLRGKITDAINVLRPGLTAFDHGSPLRNTLALTLSHPKEGWDALRTSIRAVSERGAKQVNNEMVSSKHYEEIKRAVRDFYTQSATVQQEEAYYGSRIARKLPGIGVGIRMSEDLFTTNTNVARHLVISNLIDEWEEIGVHPSRLKFDEEAQKFGFPDMKELGEESKNLTHTKTWTPEMQALAKAEEKRFKDIKAIATFIMHASGRGGLGKARAFGRELSILEFAPRWMIAYPQMIFDVTNPKISWRVRQEMIKDLAKYVSVGTAIMILVALAGGRVETDPKSSNFGQIQIANTRINLFAPFTGPIRYAAQAIKGEVTNVDTGVESRKSGPETAWKFFRSKLAPTPSLAIDLAGGFVRGNQPEDINGRPYEATPLGGFNQAYRHTAPLFIQDVVDQARMGTSRTRPLIGASFFGLPANTYSALVQRYWEEIGGKGQLRDQSNEIKAQVHSLYNADLRRKARNEREGRR